MQVVENTCIGHEISLRKISEPLALKALDFIPVTAQPQEMQCCRSTSEVLMRDINSKKFKNLYLSATPSKSRIQNTCLQNSQVQVHDEASRAHLWEPT